MDRYITKDWTEKTLEEWACIAFVALSVAIGVLGFWAKGWLPGVLLTVAMAVAVVLLSRAIARVQAAWSKGHRFTAIVAGVLAFGFALMEANLNHIGMENLNAHYDLVPAGGVALFGVHIDYLWGACVFVSAVNVFATYAFARELVDETAKASETTPARKSADVLVFGPNIAERATLREITERMKANGAI